MESKDTEVLKKTKLKNYSKPKTYRKLENVAIKCTKLKNKIVNRPLQNISERGITHVARHTQFTLVHLLDIKFTNYQHASLRSTPGGECSPSIDAGQAEIHSFVAGFHWPDHVSTRQFVFIVLIGRRQFLFCPKWAAERQRYLGDSIDISDVFQDSDNLVEVLVLPHSHRLDGLVVTTTANDGLFQRRLKD